MSDYKTGVVDATIGLAQGSDRAFATLGGWTEVYEDYLIFVLVHHFLKFRFEFCTFHGCEVALKNGVLKVYAVAFAGFEDLAQALVVADVVGDYETSSHGYF